MGKEGGSEAMLICLLRGGGGPEFGKPAHVILARSQTLADTFVS